MFKVIIISTLNKNNNNNFILVYGTYKCVV